MRHQGTSAYAGHYIAEAMDWVTGQWFEFNDEVVKHLPTGPSSSHDSQGTVKISEVQVAPCGSKDAYNMYYVDEQYLKDCTIQEIVRRESRFTSDSSSNTADQRDILSKIEQQRTDKYSTLYEYVPFGHRGSKSRCLPHTICFHITACATKILYLRTDFVAVKLEFENTCFETLRR
jgi:hypothetical protein